MLHALEEETGRFFHFEGSEGLPLDHFAIDAWRARATEIEEQAVPFRAGEEVHVDIVEPHMYNDDDAVAKVDGYLIEVVNGIPFVGEKKLVRIEEAGRTTAARRARPAPTPRRPPRRPRSARRRASAPTERSRKARRRRGAARARSRGGREAAAEAEPPRPRRSRDAKTGRRGHRRAAEAEPSEDAPRRVEALSRGRARRRPATGAGGARADGRGPTRRTTDDDAVESKPRRRGRRGGRRRSRAKAEADAPDASNVSE